MFEHILIVILILVVIAMAVLMSVLGFRLREISNVEKWEMKLENNKLKTELAKQVKLTEVANANKERYGALMEEVKKLEQAYREKISSFEDIERLYKEQLEILKQS